MKWLSLLLFFSHSSFAQLVYNGDIDLGNITATYEIKGDVVIKNNNATKTFLMRADADPGVKIYTSKKTLLPDDTCLLIISFIPENKGNFRKMIRLISTDREKPYLLSLSGSVQKIIRDDKSACYYFGNRRPPLVAVNREPINVQGDEPKRDASNKIPENPSEPITTPGMETFPPDKEKVPVKEKMVEKKKSVVPADGFVPPTPLLTEEYIPNNIIFLVDVSGSMKDSLKLPVMKNALHYLIDQIRDVDRLTFITYADTIKILKEGFNAQQREELHIMVDNLKARGMTKGRKGILFSQQVAQKNFIAGGNNQIIVLTDGIFIFENTDHKLWKERQADKKIILSTVALGQNKDALRNLRELARKGDGSFIRFENKADSKVKLMDEVKKRSKR